MESFYRSIDRVLTAVVIVFVVAMTLSISAEIILSAVVQPINSKLLAWLSAEGAAPSGWLGALEGLDTLISRSTAPLSTASETILVWLGILGSALAFRLRAHLGVDALVRAYPRRARLALDYVSTAAIGVFALAVFVVGGSKAMRHAFATGTKMSGFEWLNLGWFYLVLVLTGALILIYCVYHFMHPQPVDSAWPEVHEERRDI